MSNVFKERKLTVGQVEALNQIRRMHGLTKHALKLAGVDPRTVTGLFKRGFIKLDGDCYVLTEKGRKA